MLGIKSLTLVLAISMVFATGLILGGISISTGNASTEDARAAGDRGISHCMDSGSTSVRRVTAQLLHSVLINAVSQISVVVTKPHELCDQVATFVNMFHPDVTSSTEFLDTVLRDKMNSDHITGMKHMGPYNVFAEFVGITPNSETLRQNQNGDWGGGLAYQIGGFENGKFIRYVMERRTSLTASFNNRSMWQYGNPDERGRLIDAPCNFSAPSSKRGRCLFAVNDVLSPVAIESKNRVLYNMLSDDQDTFLSEPDTITYSPISGVGAGVVHVVGKSFVNPNQVNAYPRQKHRTGFVGVTVDTSTITSLLVNTKLPEGSVLYGAERNPWTGEVVTLTGCNIGKPYRVEKHFSEGVLRFVRGIPFTLLTHTVDGTEDGELSPISRFSEHMITMANGSIRGEYYETVSNLPPGDILDWTDTNTSVLYWVRISPLKHADLHWYMIFLVPRSSVMSVIDESADTIRAGINQDKKNTDDERQKKHVIMYVVTAVCVIILLVISLVFTNFIISPLNALSDDMAAVAVMETDSVNLKHPLSSLSEVREMQKSFRKMVENLIEYKNYMPQSVLINESDTDEEEEHQQERSRRGSGVASSMSAATKSRRSMASAHQQHVQEMGVKKRMVSVLNLNSVGWHSKDPDSMKNQHGVYITVLTTAVNQNKGVCDSFNGDRILASFNASRNINDHRASAIRSGLSAKSNSPLQLSFAVTSGEARVGNMGIVGMKKFSILSPIVPFASALERYSLHAGYSCLIDKNCAEHTKMSIDSCAAIKVVFKKLSEKAQLVFEAISTRQVKEEEWMYQLESTSTFQNYNDFVEMASKGDFAAASTALETVKVIDGIRSYEYWRSACEKKCAEPIQLEGVY